MITLSRLRRCELLWILEDGWFEGAVNGTIKVFGGIMKLGGYVFVWYICSRSWTYHFLSVLAKYICLFWLLSHHFASLKWTADEDVEAQQHMYIIQPFTSYNEKLSEAKSDETACGRVGTNMIENYTWKITRLSHCMALKEYFVYAFDVY